MRMVTPEKTEDGEVNTSKPIILKKTDSTKPIILKKTDSSKPIILKKTNKSIGVSKDVIVNDLDSEGSLGQTVNHLREPVVVVPLETKRSVVDCKKTVNLLREPVVVVPLETKRSVVDCKKRVRFSICKMDTDTNFKVTLSIKKEADGCPVFYKVDGNRFKKEKTIKLMVETPYRVDFSFKPTQTMTQAVFRGQESETTERSYDSTASAYSARLCVQDTPHSQKGHREDLDLLVQLKGGLTLQAVLQVKYYKAGDSQHCEWGSTFHCLELDCETHADAGLVAILKETFR